VIHGPCFIWTEEPSFARNPLSIFTRGALKVILAPLSMITPAPIVIEVASLHSQFVLESNVITPVRTTEHCVSGGRVVLVVVGAAEVVKGVSLP